MIHTWRWYGPNDRITLADIKQTGATGIVTALHHIENGAVWTVGEIQKRKDEIESSGLTWEVVESLPVSEQIKKQSGNYLECIANYKTSLQNLAICGITTVCYNFMPALDWSRTNLNFKETDGTYALRFERVAFVAFDLFIFKREEARKEYDDTLIAKAKAYFDNMTEAEKKELTDTILTGLPGAEESFKFEEFKRVIESYKGIDADKLKSNLSYFLNEVIPVAESAGVKMAIHPDDPPMSLLGLPRIVGSLSDVKEIFDMIDSPSNGLTFCTGSFGAGYENNVAEMIKVLAPKVNFLHLRNVSRDADRNFQEKYLLEGDGDIYEVIKESILEEKDTDRQIPMRPDHGHQMLEDIGKENYPGYSLYGRMKSLAEIRGIEYAINRNLNN